MNNYSLAQSNQYCTATLSLFISAASAIAALSTIVLLQFHFSGLTIIFNTELNQPV